VSVLFVTGTDTGVGKTVVTAALVVVARASGGSPYVVKPAQTGVTPDEAGDIDDVRRLVGEVPATEGIRLREPLAPDTAARLEGVALPTLQLQRDLILKAHEDADPVIVEGAGGILVHLGDTFDLLDLAGAVQTAGTRTSFVVVARAGLGTLNHTALTVRAIQNRGLTVDGIVIGSWPADPDLAAQQNLRDLPLATGVPLLGRVPEGSGRLAQQGFASGAAGWLSLEGLDD
jgi:dethiobiotin synthase